MKNANSRFVRVLAIALVVLMVVPAALVGCGSNKANNAAISEALAAAEAARKEAEEAKAAADAAAAEAAAKAAAEAQKALEEANKKAEEAIKAAEEAKKKAEEAEKQAAEAAKTTAAPTTTAPITTAPITEDMKVVSDYAYQVLSNKDLDFLKTYFTYAYGKDADAIAAITDVKAVLATDPANQKYTSADLVVMEKLYDATIVAIYQANTVDYINQLVANFVAALAGTPTYVERVVAAYEAIDFDSDYDVLDVVYANALVTKALGEMTAKDADTIKKYGEDDLNLVELIYTEYYRYTGIDNGADTSKVEADDILYKDMYEMAKTVTDNVISEVYTLFGVTAGADLDVTKLVFGANIEDNLEDAQDAYTKWYNKYFAKSTDESLKAAYETFRQAFVGEDYVLKYENDYAWDALTASATRVEQLLAANEEAKDFIKAVKNIAGLNTTKPADADYFKYEKQIGKVTETEAKLAAWMAKYDFKKDPVTGDVDANVAAILGATTYAAYEANALAVKYFAYLENTASSINVDAFVAASEEDLSATVDYVFNFKKYGAAVASALDWYLGKEKTTGTTTTRTGGFKDIVPEKDFADLGADFAVAKLIANNNSNLATIFEDLFDIDITKDYNTATTDKDSLFDVMAISYDLLRSKKDVADDINDEIAELLELGPKVTVLGGFADLFVGDYDKFSEADEDEKAAEITGGDIKAWATGVIVVGDENFMNLIDWDSLDEVYANYKVSLKEVIADSAEVVLEYIAWQAAINGDATYDAEDEETTFKYNGKSYVFSDLKPAQIDIFSYSRIKNVIELEKTLEDLFDSEDEDVVNTLKALTADIPDDDDELKVALTAVVDYCANMVNDFYVKASAVHSKVEQLQRITPLLAASYSTSTHAFTNAWKDSNNGSAVTADMMLEVAMYGRDTGTNGAEYAQIKGEVKAALDASAYKLLSATGYGTSAGTTASNIKLWPTSFQGAIYSVDPINYVKRNANADDKITGFDATAYKAALNTAITTAYNKFVTEYVKDATRASEFTLLIKELTTLTLNYGLWTIEGDVVIDDETYTYTINSTGAAKAFNVYDSADEKVTADITLKIDNVNYAVELVPAYDYENGKVVIEPVLKTGTLPATKKDVYDLLGLKKADLTYDIRDCGADIAANFMKVSATPAIGYATTVNYQYLTAANLQTFFKNEISNDFYATFAILRDRVYKSSGSSWGGLGNYIPATVTVPAALKDAINTVSKLERSYMHGMTPEANTIADIESEFNKFATRVKAILTDNGYTYTTAIAADGYEQITSIIAPTP